MIAFKRECVPYKYSRKVNYYVAIPYTKYKNNFYSQLQTFII